MTIFRKIIGYCLVLVFINQLQVNQCVAQTAEIPAAYYRSSTIPDSLKKDANAVIRYSFTEVVIKGAGKEVIKEHTIETLLNEKAERDAAIVLFYDKKFNSVNGAEMIVYDADGKLIKKYHKGDMYDRSATDGSSIITDDRLLAIEHTVAHYPVTIEKITEQSMNSFLTPVNWRIAQKETAIENTVYQVSVNQAVGFRYKNKNTSIRPQKGSANGFDTYTWKINNFKAIKPEDEAAEWRVMPKVMFATNAFEFNGMPGDITTWESYGKWQQALNVDVCSLTPKREEEIRQMVADIKTDKEKVKFLYDYLQKNTRYVSVALGIGGLKPFPAMFVDQKKYGDCKALSNYMSALLKAVNIPSYYTMIRAGENEEPADADFPNDPFNHIILCVPLKGDTTWLECTSSTQPFGKLGTFTENRNGLMITESGGKLVNTPKSTLEDNRFKSEVHVALDAEGGAKAQVKIWSTGEYRSMYLGLSTQKLDLQKEFLIRYLDMRQPSVLEVKPIDDVDGVKELDINMDYDKFCDIKSGDKQFYKPSVFNLWQLTLPPIDNRQTDYYFAHPMAKTCTTTIDLPTGYEIESMPANADLKFSYGDFKVNYAYDVVKNQLVSVTTFNLNRQVIPAAKYTEMQQYMDNVAKAQNKKLIIRKKA